MASGRTNPFIAAGGFLLALSILLATGVFLASRNRTREAEASATITAQPFTEAEPFQDMPPERRRQRGDKYRPTSTATEKWAGGDLEKPESWVEALEVAGRATVSFDAMREAQARGDAGVFAKHRRDATRLFREALDLSADWEAALIDEHGAAARRVRDILRVRDRWEARLDEAEQLQAR